MENWDHSIENILIQLSEEAQALSYFHLLGYRSKQVSQNYLILNNREKTSKTQIYKNEFWNK